MTKNDIDGEEEHRDVTLQQPERHEVCPSPLDLLKFDYEDIEHSKAGKAVGEPGVHIHAAGAKQSQQDKSKQPRYHLINLIMVSTCFFFVFTAFMSLQNLQASLNEHGKTCLAVLYGLLIVACFITPPLVQRLSPRGTLILCIVVHCAYTAANYYPVEYVLLPACALIGLASAPMWTAQQIYVTTSAHMYHEYTKTPAPTVGPSSKQGSAAAAEGESTIDKVMGRFNGIFFLIFQLAQISGNLISSLALRSSDAGQTHDASSTCLVSDMMNSSGSYLASNSTSNHGNSTLGGDATKSVPYTLLSVYLACDIIGLGFCIFCLRSLTKSVSLYEAKDLKSTLLATLRSTINPYMLLLIPSVIYNGMEQAFIFGEFTKHFITDCVGIDWVGYVMISMGVVNATSSMLCGQLAARLGRLPIVVAGALVNAAVLIFLLAWTRKPDLLALFLIAGAWGFVDAVSNTQLNTMFGIVFSRNQEPAFANYRLWQAVGFCISFSYGDALEMPVKLWILLGVLFLYVVLYIVAEVRWSREQKESKSMLNVQCSRPEHPVILSRDILMYEFSV
eukprot:scpid49688/ scgid5120/ Protein unc-93 homolog A